MKTVLSLVLFLVPAFAAAGADKAAPTSRRIDDFQLRDYRGAERSLHEFADRKLVVVAFVGCECPISRLYGPRLAKLAKEFEPKGVAFLGINANQQDSITAIGHYAKESGLTFPVLKDVGNVVADRFGAARTPEVFVLDGERLVRYHGRIDDQYGVGYTRPRAGQRDLAVALDELLAGKPVSQPVTEAPGCFIGRVKPEAGQGTITYCKDIAPVLQKRCVECHRRGEVAPFGLTTYESAVAWTDTIEEVLRDRRMPPWHADPKYGEFANDSRLPDAEHQLILDWIKNGTPKGDPKDLPKPPTFVKGWRIPKPDVVFTIPKPVSVPAEGTVMYQYLVIDPGFTEEKWVRAAEIRPGVRPVVHHVLVFVQPPGSRGSDSNGGFATNWLAASVPGDKPLILADGYAKRIPAGSRLLFQIHYTPNGAPQADQTSLALVFADPQTVKHEVTTEMILNRRFRIPPGDGNYRVEATGPIKEDTVLLSLMPHTHLRGKAFRFEAIYPSGDKEILLDLPHYDFNWQNTYVLAKPKLLPKGTQLHCVAYYDNSEKNFSNPNPKATVTWGEQTWEEMMIGYFNMTPASREVARSPRKETAADKDKPNLDPELEKLAQHALDSQATFDAFAAAVHKALPKVDRVCVTKFTDGKLRVERSSYPGAVSSHFAETGTEFPGRGFALVGYALFNQLAVNADLSKGRGMDLQRMGQTLGSSLHVPVALDGRPATVNFWSKEKNAFPGQTYGLLQAAARVVVRQ
jgi:peroxiredoxin